MPAPRRDVRSTPDGSSAVLPPGRSYKAHWEVLGCALCLLTAREIPRTGPVWGWGVCPGSRRPRARVPLVVRAWDLVCYPASLLWSPGPRPSPVFRSVLCDCLSLNVPILCTPISIFVLSASQAAASSHETTGAYLVWVGCMVPGLYEVIQYTLSLSFLQESVLSHSLFQ